MSHFITGGGAELPQGADLPSNWLGRQGGPRKDGFGMKRWIVLVCVLGLGMLGVTPVEAQYSQQNQRQRQYQQRQYQQRGNQGHYDNFRQGAYRSGRGGNYGYNGYNTQRGHVNPNGSYDPNGVGPGKGAAIGAGAGAILGALFGGGLKGAVVGGALGAGVGAVAGKTHQDHQRNGCYYYGDC
ncbi:MAG: hypothetical protein ABI142_00125 [Bryocella sp.]